MSSNNAMETFHIDLTLAQFLAGAEFNHQGISYRFDGGAIYKVTSGHYVCNVHQYKEGFYEFFTFMLGIKVSGKLSFEPHGK